MAVTIRIADPQADAAACAAVYAPFVTDSVVSFETEPPTSEQMASRIAAAHRWLVAEDDGVVVGYAYSSRHQERAAYRWAADVSAYIAPTHQRQGLGTAFYGDLLPWLTAHGFRMACAGITLPNPGSERLHRSVGFEPVGIYRRIGWKAGAWHDVEWLQLDLRPGDDGPPE